MSEVKYKDSGIDWIGEIPEDWKILSNKDILDTVYSGGTPDTNYPELYYIGGIYPFTTISDFTNNGKFIRKTLKKVTERGLHNRNLRLVEKGTILYSIYASIGKVAICDIDTTISQAILALYYNDKQYSVYHYYVLESMYDYIQSYGRGGTQNNINKKIFENLQVPIPPLPTQHRIAEYLDKVIPNLDKQIESYEALSKKYKELKKSEIYECVTKGLADKRDSRVFIDSGVEWIGKIPEEWNIVKNSNVMHRVKDLIQEYNNETILSLSVIGMVDRYKYGLKGKTPRNYTGYQRIKKGDLVLCLFDTDVTPCCTGIAQEDGITSPAYSRMYVDDSIADRGYYYYWYTNIKNIDCLYKLAHNVRNSISASEFSKIKVPIPPLQEQQEIATYLDKKCAIYDKLIQAFEIKVKKLKELKKSTIYEYVTGKRQVENGQ